MPTELVGPTEGQACSRPASTGGQLRLQRHGQQQPAGAATQPAAAGRGSDTASSSRQGQRHSQQQPAGAARRSQPASANHHTCMSGCRPPPPGPARRWRCPIARAGRRGRGWPTAPAPPRARPSATGGRAWAGWGAPPLSGCSRPQSWGTAEARLGRAGLSRGPEQRQQARQRVQLGAAPRFTAAPWRAAPAGRCAAAQSARPAACSAGGSCREWGNEGRAKAGAMGRQQAFTGFPFLGCRAC